MGKNNDWFVETIIDTLQTNNFDFENTEELNKVLSSVIDNCVPEISDLVLETLKSNAGEMLQEHYLIRQEFEARLFRRWAKPLNMLEMLIVISLESAEMCLFGDDNFMSLKQDGYLLPVLAKIHSRSIQISYEILCLLRGGYPDGALARWRTLYELAVTTMFIHKNGEQVAEGYFDYQHIENFREILEYQKHCKQLGYESLTQDEVDNVVIQKDIIVAKHGKAFAQEYGWAAAALGKSPSSFKDLEGNVDLSHWRPYYKLACNFVHSGPKGSYFKMGLIEHSASDDLLICGASNYGLADAGQNTVISLVQISNCMLALNPTFTSISIMKIMNILLGEIRDSFIEVQTAIEEEEKNKIRKFRSRKKV